MAPNADRNGGMDLSGSFRHCARMLDEIFELAASQHGLVTRAQLRARGVDHRRVSRWLAKGMLRKVDVNTMAIAGAPETPMQAVMAAVLETGHDASASHTTAAAIWGIAGFRLKPVHVVVCRISRHHHRLPWNVHQFTGRVAEYQRVMEGVPVTEPDLTMLHLASMISLPRLRRAVDNAWSLGLVNGDDLGALVDRLGRQGRDGIVNLRRVVEERGPGWVPPQSNLESRFLDLVQRTGIDFERQVRIETETWAARVDFLHRASRTVVEIQSERYHTALTDVDADKMRQRRLEALGYRVLEVWDHELFYAADQVLDRVWRSVYRIA